MPERFPEVDQFLTKLIRRQICGSFDVAKMTAELMRLIVSSNKWSTTASLIETIQSVGDELVKANPIELAIGNIVRRTLYIIREEHVAVAGGGQKGSLDDRDNDFNQSLNIRPNVIDGLNDSIDEIQHLYTEVAKQAIEHIHANEVILTFGKSRTVEKFLKEAAKKRMFEVIVAESAPNCCGHSLVKTLSEAGIKTTLIPDSAIFAIMARVNKVIIGTHAVMADGALVAHAGTNLIAQAAKHYSVPVVVCTGLYKLCPQYSFDVDTFNDLLPPAKVLQFNEANKHLNLTVKNPGFDFVPAELISLFVTNIGGHNPSYVYRLLVEYYHPEDNTFE
eukprot:GFYU01006876.1.p1 GENE.GFYU01006876.1~~GFYU01006876.1.p1  ORF type:complete len:351 (-),score=91.30 GFYU01006876.1:146-1147(-)